MGNTNTYTHRGEGGLGSGGLHWWWWCKAVTEIEGDGVAAAGCSVHCQSGMINEWRPQLSLTFGEPHRTSAELSALWQGQSWTTNYFAITKVGCQLNPSHSLRQGQANFSFTYTHRHTHKKKTMVLHGHAHIHTNKRTNRPVWTGTHGHRHKVDWHAHMNTHARPLLPAQGPGQNRVNPCAAGGGNPMQVTHSK